MRTLTFTYLSILLVAYTLTGCSLDRWVGVEAGDYVITDAGGRAHNAVRKEIEGLNVDREKRRLLFSLADGSTVEVSFVARDRSEWPAGCPANFNSTRMEVLDIEKKPLSLASVSFQHPILVRNCPPDPVRLVLREDGTIGGSGTACADREQCVFFSPP
jgi:hypothetical protein